jgi:four helix bundle protein
MRRAVISIMSNIAEGSGRKSTRELLQFLYIAKSSAGELESQLTAAFDQGYLNRPVFAELHRRADMIQRMLGAFIKRLAPVTHHP